MSDVAEILKEIETHLGVIGIYDSEHKPTLTRALAIGKSLERISALLSSHAVIDKETAEVIANYFDDAGNLMCAECDAEELMKAELSRLSTTK